MELKEIRDEIALWLKGSPDMKLDRPLEQAIAEIVKLPCDTKQDKFDIGMDIRDMLIPKDERCTPAK